MQTRSIAPNPAPGSNSAWLELEGRVTVITGAAGGIGSGIARAFARAGAPVALLDFAAPALAAFRDELTAAGHSALAIECDVGDPAAVDRAADQVKASLGPCRILVNTAAVLSPGDLLELGPAAWNRMLSINLGGYFACAQSFGRHMKAKGGGSMVHIASTAGWLAQPHSGAYSVTKAGIKMLSQLLAAELGVSGIRSNVVSPGMVRTPMSESFYRDADLLRRREKIVPLGRIGDPADVAEQVLFLASDRAGYVTGQDLIVDGGVMTALATLVPRPGYEGPPA